MKRTIKADKIRADLARGLTPVRIAKKHKVTPAYVYTLRKRAAPAAPAPTMFIAPTEASIREKLLSTWKTENVVAAATPPAPPVRPSLLARLRAFFSRG